MLIIAHQHPLTPGAIRSTSDGETIAAIVARLYPGGGELAVTIHRDGRAVRAEPGGWAWTRPKAGATVEIRPVPTGPLAALLPLAAGAGAQWLGGTILGLTGVGLNAFVAGATILSQLAAQALVKPPDAPAQEVKRYRLGGASNAPDLYGVVPTVYGRHRMYPPASASGYTENVGRDVYLSGRLCLGYGPVALEQLRIGETPITSFSDVELEFLNVDQAETLARQPELAAITRAWRQGAEALTIYSRNIAQTGYSVGLEQFVPVVRETRDRTERIMIDVTFTGGLIFIDNKGRQNATFQLIRIRYRRVGEAGWTLGETLRCDGATQEPISFTSDFAVPSGRYEVEVTRMTRQGDADGYRDDPTLTAIRSVRAGGLPSHPDLAEIGYRIRASEQLSGTLDTLNAVVNRMVPTLSAGRWTEPRITRHPAWAALDVYRGAPALRPLDDAEIDLAAYEAWAVEEPHWTYDAVVGDTRVDALLSEIHTAGYRRPLTVGFLRSPIPDRAKDTPRGLYSPHNSSNFVAHRTYAPEVHGFRVRVISEREDWQSVEIPVYFDGYGPDNATKLETLDFPGVVVTEAQATQGNAWRLGRLMLAAAILRPWVYEWDAGIDHLQHAPGDKVLIAHDVIKAGVGSGRIAKAVVTDGAVTRIHLDEAHDAQLYGAVDQERFRLRMTVRRADGSLATCDVDRPIGLGRGWRVLTPIDGIRRGDVVALDLLDRQSVEGIILGKTAIANDGARITAIQAAPGVLDAIDGPVPSYVAQITNPVREGAGVRKPRIVRVIADETMIEVTGATSAARIGVIAEPSDAATLLQLRWRKVGAAGWRASAALPVGSMLRTDPLDNASYDLAVIAIDATGRASDPVAIGPYAAPTFALPPPTPDGFAVTVSNGAATAVWEPVEGIADIASYRIRYSPMEVASWEEALPWAQAAHPSSGASTGAPARAGAYLIRTEDRGGRLSVAAATHYLSPSIAARANIVAVEDFSDWAGALTGVEVDNGLVLSPAEVTPDLPIDDWGPIDDHGPLEEDRRTLFQPVGTFEPAGVIDLGADYTCFVSAALDLSIDDLDALPIDDWGPIDLHGPIDGVAEGAFGIEAQIMVRTGDAVTGTWSAWRRITAGAVAGSAFRARVVLTSAGKVSAVVRAFSLTVDMPDRTASGHSAGAAAAVPVAFVPAFAGGDGQTGLPVVQITARDAPTGATFAITGESLSGFTITFTDAQGTPIAQPFDWFATGYGAEAA